MPESRSPLPFHTVIAVTALVLAVSSAIVNYRQNDLSALERNMRDTRDQLQLAKNDISDIRLKTVQQLVDAELAIKQRQGLLDEKAKLADRLAEANIRIAELEAQVRRLDRGEQPVATVAKLSKTAMVTPAGCDLDLFVRSSEAGVREQLRDALAADGFEAQFPEPSKGMRFADVTTVFYYSTAFRPMAAKLVAKLSESGARVIMRRGSSPFAANKLVVHIVD